MRRRPSLMVVCTSIFLSLMPGITDAGDNELPGLDVFVVGHHAYVAAESNGLNVIDIRIPAEQKRVAAVETPGEATGVYVISSFAYVADGSAGLQVVDISNPASPALSGSVDTPGEAQDVYPLYDLLIVADGSSGLQLIDARKPTALNSIGAYNTPGDAHSVYGLASKVYVGGRSDPYDAFFPMAKRKCDRNELFGGPLQAG